MDIEQTDDGKNGMFYVQNDGVIQAEMTYVWSGDKRIIIDHTGVSEVLKGKKYWKAIGTKSSSVCHGKANQNFTYMSFCKSGIRVNTSI